MTCVHCRFEVSLDDVQLVLSSGAICLICYEALAELPRSSYERLARLLRDVEVG